MSYCPCPTTILPLPTRTRLMLPCIRPCLRFEGRLVILTCITTPVHLTHQMKKNKFHHQHDHCHQDHNHHHRLVIIITIIIIFNIDIIIIYLSILSLSTLLPVSVFVFLFIFLSGCQSFGLTSVFISLHLLVLLLLSVLSPHPHRIPTRDSENCHSVEY